MPRVYIASGIIRYFSYLPMKHEYNLLRSVPYIVGLAATCILAEVGDLRRFWSFKKFAGFVGLLLDIYRWFLKNKQSRPIYQRDVMGSVQEDSAKWWRSRSRLPQACQSLRDLALSILLLLWLIILLKYILQEWVMTLCLTCIEHVNFYI